MRSGCSARSGRRNRLFQIGQSDSDRDGAQAGGRRSRERGASTGRWRAGGRRSSRAHFRADVGARRTSTPRGARQAGRQEVRPIDEGLPHDGGASYTRVRRRRTDASRRALRRADPRGPDWAGGSDRSRPTYPPARGYLAGRRLRGAAARRSEPPSAASRLALSRATSARSPSCTTAVFSRMPLSAWARAISSASRTRVVRIHISMHHLYASCHVRSRGAIG